MKIKTLSLIIWIAGIQLIGFTIGNFFGGGTDSWYLNINKSNLTPPGYVFGIAWTLLYVLIAVAGWLLWSNNPPDSDDNQILIHKTKVLFITQLLLNWLWTPLFFTYHLTLAALVTTSLIIICTGLIIIHQRKYKPLISYLLTPYLLWLCFAFYLNAFIILNN